MVRTVKSQTEKTALLLGVGYTAKALLSPLKAAGYSVIGTCRSAQKTTELSKRYGIDMLAFSGSPSSQLRDAFTQADVIVSSIPPADDGSDPVLTAFGSSLQTQAKWVGYLSATSVYGDRDGQWVFEDEGLSPGTDRGRNRVYCELAWLESGLPVHIFRLAGIYGPHIIDETRNPYERIKSGRARAVIKPGHIVNRIHVEDIAQALMLSMNRPDPLMIYNLADDRPAPPQDVLNFAADMLSTTRPISISHDDATLSDMARSFYTETKRVSNQRAKNQLGWEPVYKTYRHGLMSIWRENNDWPEAFIMGGYVIAPEDDLPNILSEMPKHIALSRAEPGCVRFDLWQDDIDPMKLHMIEIFKDLNAAEFHRDRMKHTNWKKAAANIERDYCYIGV